MSLYDDKQAAIIDAFNTASRYLDDILNIDNTYFDNMVKVSKEAKIRNRYTQVSHLTQDTTCQIYPSEHQHNKTSTYDTKARFWICIFPLLMIFSLKKIYDKRGNFDFDIVNYPF